MKSGAILCALTLGLAIQSYAGEPIPAPVPHPVTTTTIVSSQPASCDSCNECTSCEKKSGLFSGHFFQKLKHLFSYHPKKSGCKSCFRTAPRCFPDNYRFFLNRCRRTGWNGGPPPTVIIPAAHHHPH